jgi:hypothetical protein
VTAEQAVHLDAGGYGAHVIAAAALRDQKLYGEATRHLQTAMALAPEETRPQLLHTITEARIVGQPPDAPRRLDVLMIPEQSGSSPAVGKGMRSDPL